MNTIKIKPNPNCKYCHGSGEVYDTVDYGSTVAHLPSLCECVESQLPDDYNDEEIEIDNSKKTLEKEFCDMCGEPLADMPLKLHYELDCKRHVTYSLRQRVEKLEQKNNELEKTFGPLFNMLIECHIALGQVIKNGVTEETKETYTKILHYLGDYE